MIVARLFLPLLLFGQQLYEEKLSDTFALREQLYQQMNLHADQQLLRHRLGYPALPLAVSGPLRLERTGEDAVATYYRLFLPVSHQMDAYGLYIVPKKLAARRAPLVISQHGGGGTPESATFNGASNYKDQVRGAVAEGYVVFAPWTVMYPFGDRNNGTTIPPDVRKQLDEKFRSVGSSLFAVEVRKISLVLDELVKRPEIDPRRIAMIGLSYGGYYSLYTAALEPRIGVVVASGSFADIAPLSPATIEGRPYDLRTAEIAALIAPRPLQLQIGNNDQGLPVEISRRAAARVALVYEKLKAKDRFAFETFDGGHEFHGSLVWPFLKKWL
jgi:dienelactone hydrolase